MLLLLYIEWQSRKFDAPQQLIPNSGTGCGKNLRTRPPRSPPSSSAVRGSSPPHLPKGGAERDRV